jgi:hypothetical protein
VRDFHPCQGSIVLLGLCVKEPERGGSPSLSVLVCIALRSLRFFASSREKRVSCARTGKRPGLIPAARIVLYSQRRKETQRALRRLFLKSYNNHVWPGYLPCGRPFARVRILSMSGVDSLAHAMCEGTKAQFQLAESAETGAESAETIAMHAKTRLRRCLAWISSLRAAARAHAHDRGEGCQQHRRRIWCAFFRAGGRLLPIHL